MSDFKIFDIAGSGLKAQNMRMNLIASNIANADSISSSQGEVYKSRQPVFKTIMQNQGSQVGRNNAAASVEMVAVVESKAPVFPEFAPNHPMANEDGYIFRSNVNTVEEMANMISAQRSFQNNIDVIKSSNRMMTSIINLGKQ
jgi:flagellar basal-body rod protein FlgC